MTNGAQAAHMGPNSRNSDIGIDTGICARSLILDEYRLCYSNGYAHQYRPGHPMGVLQAALWPVLLMAVHMTDTAHGCSMASTAQAAQ